MNNCTRSNPIKASAACATRGMSRPRAGAGNEGGFMIVLSLLILFTLTLLGLTSIINTTIDSKIASNENNANRALYSADAGLAHALTLLNNGTISPTFPSPAYPHTNPDWRYPAANYVESAVQPGLSMYRWYMNFKPNSENLAPTKNSSLVYFNQAFGYNKSLFSGDPGDEGYPVIEIHSDGIVSSGGTATSPMLAQKELVLEIGRNHFNVKVEGAITARSTVSLTGTISVNGFNHDINGNPGGACGTDMPGVFVDTGKTTTLSGVADADGNPPTQVNPDARTIARSPWEALGIEEAQMPASITPAAVVEPLSGFTYVNGDYDLEAGSGILVVHNPLFDATKWEVSVPASAAYNTGSPDYDPKLDTANAAYDAAYAVARRPAKFAAHGDSVFKGVIIADSVDKINGTINIIGAVLSLTSVEVSHFGNGTANILYSCEAISQYAQVGYATKLVWRRL